MSTIDFTKNDTYRRAYDNILQIKKHANSKDELPTLGASNGDIYTVGDSKSMYIYNEGWSPVGSSDSGGGLLLRDAYFIKLGQIGGFKDANAVWTSEGLRTAADLSDAVMKEGRLCQVFIQHIGGNPVPGISAYDQASLSLTFNNSGGSDVVSYAVYTSMAAGWNPLADSDNFSIGLTRYPDKFRVMAELLPSIPYKLTLVNQDLPNFYPGQNDGEYVMHLMCTNEDTPNTSTARYAGTADGGPWIFNIDKASGVVKSIRESGPDDTLTHDLVYIDKLGIDKFIGKQVMQGKSSGDDRM